MRQTKYGILLFILLLFPPVISGLESVMILHMLVQVPLLILAGVLMGEYGLKKCHQFFKTWNKDGIPGIILVYFITMYWMVPRAMDDTLLMMSVEIFKFISLPFLVGMVLRDSWPKLSGVWKGFMIFNYLPMFGVMAWLYIDSPIQICNNYLESEQKLLGWGFLIIMLFMIIYILQFAFIDQSEKE